MPRFADRPLTAKGIERIKPPKKGMIQKPDGDVPGMALRVFAPTRTAPKGTYTFTLTTRIDGRQRRVTLGHWPNMRLSEARTKAQDILENGLPEPEPEAETFGQLAEDYIAREVPRLKRGADVESVIRRELLLKWSNRPLAELRKRDVIALTDALLDAGKPGAAHKLHETIRRLGRWAVKRDLLEADPFALMGPPVAKVERERVLKPVGEKPNEPAPNEIRALWRAWDAVGFPFGPMQKFLLVTGARLREVAEISWPELDVDAAIWTLPRERTKSDRAIEIPLSSLALGIIAGLPVYDEEGFVFTTTGGERPVSGFSKMKARTDTLVKAVARSAKDDVARFKKTGLEPWRVHDLRRTVRTALAELKVDDTVAERLLNHVEPDRVKRTYNRYSYWNEKVEAAELWANHLRAILGEPASDNMVQVTRTEAQHARPA